MPRWKWVGLGLSAALCAACAERSVEPATLTGCQLPASPDRRYAGAAPAEGPFPSHRNSAWREGAELIEVRWLPIGFPFGLHEVLVYTQRNGEQRVIAAFPEREESWKLDFGTIVIADGPYDPKAKDPFTQDLDDDSRRLIVAEAEDLSAVWRDMQAIAAVIDRLGIVYRLFRVNSNSAAETVLSYAGYPPTEESLWGDVAADVDVIAHALRNGDGVCDDPDDEVNRAVR